jgi:hypothetical protein
LIRAIASSICNYNLFHRRISMGIYKHGITPSSRKAEARDRVGTARANHIVARVSGVNATDSKVEAAEKVIATMRLAEFPAAAIRKAERMLAQAKARGVK